MIDFDGLIFIVVGDMFNVFNQEGIGNFDGLLFVMVDDFFDGLCCNGNFLGDF